MATIANLKVNLLADSTGLNRSLADATAKMQAFGTKMANIGATMSTRLTLPIVGIGVSMVKAASDAEETATKFAVVFRDVEQGATKAFETLRNEYGLSTNASKELLGNTGDLLTGFGFSQQAALELSTEVNKLAVDLASFTNFSGGATGASQALTKALLGERESVKSLGISILEEDVQKQVAINTTNGLTFASERQAKAYATLQIAQSQSKNAIGDYARTQDGLANQTRLLQQRMNDLAVSFGEIMVPAVNKIVGRLTAMTEGLRDMNPETKAIILGIAGFVAIAGPVVFAIGKITTAVSALTVTMMANPYIALGAAVLAIGTYAFFATRGVDGLNDKIRESLGLEASLKGTQDERNKLLKEQERLQSELNTVQDKMKSGGLNPGQMQALAMTEASIKRQMEEVKNLAREWKAVGDATKLADSVTASLGDTVETIGGSTSLESATGSIAALTAELESLEQQFVETGDSVKRAQLGAQINQLTNEIEGMNAVAKANILPITAPMERATIATQKLTSSIGGLNRGFIPLAQAPVTITEMTASMVIAQQTALSFTDSFGAGMANLIVQGGKLSEVLSNIGKLLLSSAIQTGIKLLLMGTSGFGVKGGSTGLLGGLFSPSVSAVPTGVMGAGTMSVSGSFKVQGTDLIAVINRSERQLR
jgi:hypothetical protein